MNGEGLPRQRAQHVKRWAEAEGLRRGCRENREGCEVGRGAAGKDWKQLGGGGRSCHLAEMAGWQLWGQLEWPAIFNPQRRKGPLSLSGFQRSSLVDRILF